MSAKHDYGDRQQHCNRLDDLARRVEALLASEEPPEGLRRALEQNKLAPPRHVAWDWFREQLLGGTAVEPLAGQRSAGPPSLGELYKAISDPGSLTPAYDHESPELWAARAVYLLLEERANG